MSTSSSTKSSSNEKSWVLGAELVLLGLVAGVEVVGICDLALDINGVLENEVKAPSLSGNRFRWLTADEDFRCKFLSLAAVGDGFCVGSCKTFIACDKVI